MVGRSGRRRGRPGDSRRLHPLLAVRVSIIGVGLSQRRPECLVGRRSCAEVVECPRLTRFHYAKHARRAQPEEYVGSIQRVAFGQAEKLEFGEGEPTQAVRRRLNAAAEALGKELQVRRSANAVYFWTPEARRRGRPRKDPDQ